MGTEMGVLRASSFMEQQCFSKERYVCVSVYT
jgi:hypothetical protein